MRSPFALFRRSAMPRWMLALAMLLNVIAGGMPMPTATSAAITDPAMIALALLNPDICLAPTNNQAPKRPVRHHYDSLLCPVCMAHGAITVSAPPLLPAAPNRLIGHVSARLAADLPPGPALDTPRARGPPRASV
jgi:hypothetical protein